MKNIYKIILILGILIFPFSSCDYRDVVPDNTATIEDAFTNDFTARRSVLTLYRLAPDVFVFNQDMARMGSDEMIYIWQGWWHFAKEVMLGNLTANNPQFNFWSAIDNNGDDADLYDAIRMAYIIEEQLEAKDIPKISEQEKQGMIGEVKFFQAYYHFLLLRQYGPIIIMEDIEDINDPVYRERQPYDDCVNWIASKLDEAIELLPQTYSIKSYYGRITKPAASAIKARMLLYAASPLFNGGGEIKGSLPGEISQYMDKVKSLSNVDGTRLFSEYNREKWNIAAKAIKEAIDMAEASGHSLIKEFTPSNESIINAKNQGKIDQAVIDTRFAVVEPYNTEQIWPSAGNDAWWSGCREWQGHVMPRQVGAGGWPYNGVCPTLEAVEGFYTKNGLPIDQDNSFDYADRYEITLFVKMNGFEDKTVKLHLNREPRFYTNIAFNRGFYEIGDTILSSLDMYANENWGKGIGGDNFSVGGYLAKKTAHPSSNTGTDFHLFTWPVIRLADLYLAYAEALNEYNGPTAEVYQYINRVRARAGIPSVEEAWNSPECKTPGFHTTKEGMRSIIQTERNIELYSEGHKAWDARRWLRAHEWFNRELHGWSVDGRNAEEFYQKKAITTYRFYPEYYLWPLPLKEIEINNALVQNPNW